MAFERPDLIILCMRQLSKFQSLFLYIMGDGPRNKKEESLCSESRMIAENLLKHERISSNRMS